MWGLAGPAAWSGHLLNVTGSVVFDGAGFVLWGGLLRGAGPEVVVPCPRQRRRSWGALSVPPGRLRSESRQAYVYVNYM